MNRLWRGRSRYATRDSGLQDLVERFLATPPGPLAAFLFSSIMDELDHLREMDADEAYALELGVMDILYGTPTTTHHGSN